MSVVAIDPGVTTGVAWVRELSDLTNPEVTVRWKAGNGFHEVVGDDEKMMIDSLLNGLGRIFQRDPIGEMGHVLVIEDFILSRQSFTQKRELLAPVRVSAVVDFWVRDTWPEVLVEYQLPTRAKTTATDSRLKAYGLWVPSMRHARDAVRHLLTYALRQKGTG